MSWQTGASNFQGEEAGTPTPPGTGPHDQASPARLQPLEWKRALLSGCRWKLPGNCLPSLCRTTLPLPPKPVWQQPCPAARIGASLAPLTLAYAAHLPAPGVAMALVGL